MRQPEQQQQGSLAARRRCPSCPREMRLVGRETVPGSTGQLLTFQCECGQLIATPVE